MSDPGVKQFPFRRIVNINWGHRSATATYAFALDGTRSSSIAGSCTPEDPIRDMPAGADSLATDYMVSGELITLDPAPSVPPPSNFTVVDAPTPSGSFSFSSWEIFGLTFDAGPMRDLNNDGILEADPQLSFSGSGAGSVSVDVLNTASFMDTAPHCYGGDLLGNPGSYGVPIDLDGGKYQATDGSTGQFTTAYSVSIDISTSLVNTNDGRSWPMSGWNATVTRNRIVVDMTFRPSAS